MVRESTGAASLTIPIKLPPATGDLSPELALVYSSDAGNGPLGVGWSLQLGDIGLGAVRISTRFGFPATPAEEDYELNGEMLVPSATESGRYHTRIERFMRIRQERPSRGSWTVERPDGTSAVYGDNEAALIRGDGGRIFEWMLSSLTSASGNVLQVEYLRTPTDPGIAYPQRLLYTLRNGSPVGELREVLFVWEARPDELADFMGFTKRVQGLRLREVQVRVGGRAFSRRTFGYAPGGPSKLVRTQLFGTDCAHTTSNPEQSCQGLPAQTFTYSVLDPGAGESAYWSIGDPNAVPVPLQTSDIPPNIQTRGLGAGVRFGDVNGDGRPDLLQAYRNGYGGITHAVYLNNGSGWNVAPDPTYTASLQSIRTPVRYSSYGTGSWPSSVSIVDKGIQPILFNDNFAPDKLSPPGSSYGSGWQLQDLNGDGYSDLSVSYTVGATPPGCPNPAPGQQITEIWLLQPQTRTWVRHPLSDVPGSLPAYYSLTSGKPRFGDFDGDGLVDIAVLEVVGGQFLALQANTAIFSNPFGRRPSVRLPAPDALPDGQPFAHQKFDNLGSTTESASKT